MTSDVIPVERLTRVDERFRCEPFRAVLTVRACLARQGATFDAGRNQHHGPSKLPAHPTCAGCSAGKVIASQVAVSAPSVPVCGVCGVPVTGAKGRKPLCPLHRKKVSHVG